MNPRLTGPVVGLVSVLNVVVLAVASVLLPPSALQLVVAVLLGYGLLAVPELLHLALARVLRLRWFMLAIAVLYLGGAPGGGVLAGDFSGGLLALHRILVLVMLMLTVTLMLGALAPADLAAALVALLRPLRHLGLPSETVAHRLATTMDAVSHMDDIVRTLRVDGGHGPIAMLAMACEHAEQHRPRLSGDHAPSHQPSWYWIVPVVLAGALVGLRQAWSL